MSPNPLRDTAPVRGQNFCYFVLAVLGFSFWFFMAVPFASHRESYWWLAMVQSHDFASAFSFISSTYRPLHQAVTWMAFLILDPGVFPTSAVRQTMFQVSIYGLFVLAWWLIYGAATQRRLFAVLSFVVGGVFFSGYVQLFHIYGVSYVPVMLMLGVMLHLRTDGRFGKYEVWLSVVATFLVFWHPFTTALFVAYYFGYCLETFGARDRAQHARSILLLLVASTAVVALVVVVPRLWPTASQLLVETATRPVGTRFLALLVSYQTNEVNGFASALAFVLTQLAVVSAPFSRKLKVAAFVLACALSVVFLLNGLPLLLLWVAAAVLKALLLRSWSLSCLLFAAASLPFGGGIGTPIHALFAIIVATYVTALGWVQAENALAAVKNRYVLVPVIVAAIVVLLVRAGIDVPIVTRVARPLLAERERTYQLEDILAWLHNSAYCGDDIAFAEKADNPIDSLAGAIERRNRPPASLTDVQFFWKTVLQCRNGERPTSEATVIFGGPAVADSSPVYEVGGRYAGTASVWIRNVR